MSDIDFMDLDEDLGAPLKPVGKARHFHDANRIDTRSEDSGARFDCKDCRGTGRWTYSYGSRAGETKDCYKCRGRGWFKSSQEDRDSAKDKRQQQKFNAAKSTPREARGLAGRLWTMEPSPARVATTGVKTRPRARRTTARSRTSSGQSLTTPRRQWHATAEKPANAVSAVDPSKTLSRSPEASARSAPRSSNQPGTGTCRNSTESRRRE